MKLINILDLGMNLEYMWLSDMWRPNVWSKKGKRMLGMLGEARDILEGEGMGETVVKDLSRWITRLKKDYPKENTKISQEDVKELVRESAKWHQGIREEIEQKSMIEVGLQTGLNPKELAKVVNQQPSDFIPAEVLAKMTSIEKSDLSDAAKCLLSGTATPSVMVALRGAEASLRNFYSCKTKTDPSTKTWRQLTKVLKDKGEELGIESTFVGYLDYIGEAKRNFAQHPNKVYLMREAVIIFMQVAALIGDIYTKI